MKLVLLPGMDGTGDLFSPLISALPGKYEPLVIVYPCDEALGYPELANLVHSKLPKGESFVLLAESFSGPVAVSVAASCPEGLCGLVLVSTFLRSPLPVPIFLHHLLGQLPRVSPSWLSEKMLFGNYGSIALRQLLSIAISKVTTKVWRSRFLAVLSVNVVELAKKVMVPVLYLHPTKDHLLGGALGNQICQALPKVLCVEVSAPHALLQTKPKEAAMAILEFIENLQLKH